MAYYQLHQANNKDLRIAVFISTGGNPTVEQMRGVLTLSPVSYTHLRDAVLVEGFIQIGISDFAKPIIRMRGKSGKFRVFQDLFLSDVRCIFGIG